MIFFAPASPLQNKRVKESDSQADLQGLFALVSKSAKGAVSPAKQGGVKNNQSC